MVIQRMMCDDCGGGEMIFAGKTLNAGTKPLYVHKCNKCGELGVFSHKYPVNYEERNDDDTD